MVSATGPTGVETLPSSADQSATAGLVMEFLRSGLKNQAAPANDKFSNWDSLTTSSPGFGGIFVQLN